MTAIPLASPMPGIDSNDRRPAPAGASRLLARLGTALSTRTDTAGLVAFRVILGLLLSTIAIRYLAYGWVDRFFVRPTFHFKYWGLSWVQPWPPTIMYLHFVVLAVLGLCIAAGLFYRFAAIGAFIGLTYLELIDVSLYINHYYLVSLLTLLAAFMPLGQAGSLDTRVGRKVRRTTFPAWCTHLLRVQMSIVYFFAGLAKLSSDWLIHAQPMGIWLHARTETPVVGAYFDDWRVAMAMSWAGFLFDLTIWVWLWKRSTRPYAFAVVVGFHLTTYYLFPFIGMFPLIMMASALVFFSPSWPRRVWAALTRTSVAPVSLGKEAPTGSGDHSRPRQNLGFALVALYLAAQVLVPLRHYLYPGDVLWHEQGMRFSWKVMAREKNGSITYYVHLPDTGRTQIVRPEKYLADYQAREMSTQPDLILQLAQQIADDYHRQGHASVEVRAEALVSLNGRRPALLIDPEVDLTKVHLGLAPAQWIRPAPQTAPIRLKRLGDWS